MIIATTEQEVDRILDHFIAEGFISVTGKSGYQPDLNDWRQWIKDEHLSKKQIVLFDPHWEYDPAKNLIVKFINWHVPDTIDEYLSEDEESD